MNFTVCVCLCMYVSVACWIAMKWKYCSQFAATLCWRSFCTTIICPYCTGQSVSVCMYVCALIDCYANSYYEQHGEFIKASNLMSMIARSDGDTNIEIRADYLHKGMPHILPLLLLLLLPPPLSSLSHPTIPYHTITAMASAQRAISNSSAGGQPTPSASIQLLLENLNELKDILDVVGNCIVMYPITVMHSILQYYGIIT